MSRLYVVHQAHSNECLMFESSKTKWLHYRYLTSIRKDRVGSWLGMNEQMEIIVHNLLTLGNL